MVNNKNKKNLWEIFFNLISIFVIASIIGVFGLGYVLMQLNNQKDFIHIIITSNTLCALIGYIFIDERIINMKK